MEVGRRQFMEVCGCILAKLATQPSPAVYQQDDVYINRRLGVAFSRPAGWNFVRVDEMGEVQQGQLLAIDDPIEKSGVLRLLDLPFVALSPEESYDGEGTAGIQFYMSEPPAHNRHREHDPPSSVWKGVQREFRIQILGSDADCLS